MQCNGNLSSFQRASSSDPLIFSCFNIFITKSCSKSITNVKKNIYQISIIYIALLITIRRVPQKINNWCCRTGVPTFFWACKALLKWQSQHDHSKHKRVQGKPQHKILGIYDEADRGEHSDKHVSGGVLQAGTGGENITTLSTVGVGIVQLNKYGYEISNRINKAWSNVNHWDNLKMPTFILVRFPKELICVTQSVISSYSYFKICLSLK